MDQVERRVADRLAASGERRVMPGDLAERVRGKIEVRRRRRRHGLILGSAVAVAAVLTVPVIGLVDLRADPSTPAGPSPNQPDRPAAVGDAAPVTISRELPGGSVFQVRAFGVDGTVIGVGVREDGDWDDQLWMAGPQDPVLRPVAGPGPADAVFAPAVSDQTLFWVASHGEPDGPSVICTDLGRGDAPHVLGGSGMLRGFAPVLADRGVAVWTDQGGREDATPTVWIVAGCEDEPRALARGSEAVAFAYPDVFVLPLAASAGDKAASDSLAQLDVEIGEATGELSVPPGLRRLDDDAPSAFAANEATIAWTDGSSLAVADRGTGSWETVVADLPISSGSNGTETHVTAGTRIVAYSSVPITISGLTSGLAQSISYDPGTGQSQAWPGELYAAGDWLLWEGSEGDEANYYLGRVAE